MENQEKSSSAENEQIEYIEKYGTAISDRIHAISIIGQIEGHYVLPSEQKATKYEHIVPLLVSVERSEDIDGLLIILNTMGGDVEAGLAISELISSMKKPSVSLVLGGGHSIGVPLAVSARRSFIVPSATMTIHPVRVSGTVIGSPQTYYYFEKMQNRIVKFVCEHSKIAPEKFKALMLETEQIATDVGSVINGYEAVEIGLIDEIGGLSDALACLEGLINENKKATCDGDSCPI
jgi:ATP-dependent protease ClpP protease subunit